jgi:hypothetical protein
MIPFSEISNCYSKLGSFHRPSNKNILDHKYIIVSVRGLFILKSKMSIPLYLMVNKTILLLFYDVVLGFGTYRQVYTVPKPRRK